MMLVEARSDPSRVPDLARIAPAGLEVLETASGNSIRRIGASPSFRFAFSGSGRYVAAAGVSAIQIFDLATGKEAVRFAAPEEFRSFTGDDCCACCLAFSPDAKALATGLPDGTTL